MLGAFLVGAAGMIYITKTLGTSLEDPETIFMVLVNSLFHPAIAGILLAAILAAVMSTADSQLLVSSSALAEDFYKALFRKKCFSKRSHECWPYCCYRYRPDSPLAGHDTRQLGTGAGIIRLGRIWRCIWPNPDAKFILEANE